MGAYLIASPLPQASDDVVALTDAFAGNLQKQQAWRGFLRKHQLTTELELTKVVERLGAFLIPVSAAASRKEKFGWRWDGGWHD